MSASAYSLRRRMVGAFAVFALTTAVLFGAFCLIFVYTVEDSFFNRMLAEEAAHQQRAWTMTGTTAAPLRPFVTVHRSAATFPADLARRTAGGARGSEFAGEQGRHYHLRPVPLADGGQLVLVAEVSRELVVRPSLPFILSALALLAGAILILTLGAGYWLARRATAPLRQLTDLVSNAAPGQLPRDFTVRFPDNEIGLLARTLDDAMARIAGFIEREQHFTRDASHELRTPLTVIDGAAQLLAQQPLPAQAAAQLQRIRAACAHMAQTVDALLALAREELGSAPRETVALLPIVERAVVDHAPLLEGKAVEVSVEVDPGDSVDAHPAVLAILVGNLVGNAFAHTGQGEVRISFDGGSLVVADSGPGIALEVRERLFEAGAKGHASGGHGLGLSIAARLAARSGVGLAIDSSAGGSRAALHFSR